MSVFLLSVTHRTAPLAVRERLALDDAARQAVLTDLANVTGEAVAITTCNRTELYGAALDATGSDRALALLAEHAGLSRDALAPFVVHCEGAEATRHLFRVAAGLDSQIVGEPQILGQVRNAVEVAREVGTTGPVLSKLFNLAVETGKRARSETPISQGAGSVSHAAVELARSILSDLPGQRTLVIGVGEMGHLVAKNLVAHGVRDLAIANRTLVRAEETARMIGGYAILWETLDEALAEVDIAITTTGAREPVLALDRMRQVVERRGGRPLLLIDISVPRNIEPSVGTLPGVHLRDLDTLHTIRQVNLANRQAAIPQVEAIIEEQVSDFMAWYRGRAVAPVIRELREYVDAIREQEVEKALRRLGHLSERDRQVVLALSHGLANKLLHTPITRLKAGSDQEICAQTVADLFDLAAD